MPSRARDAWFTHEGTVAAVIVAVTGSASRTPRMIARLKACLARRGFRVRLLGESRAEGPGDADILLIFCCGSRVDQLARRVEEEWMNRWLAWYSAQRYPSGATGRPGPRVRGD